MGKREQHLREIVAKKFSVIDETSNYDLHKVLQQSPYHEELLMMYKNICTNQFHDKGLGGILESYPTEIGPWDITVIEGFRIELDEQQHFNRYRSITLDSNVYQRSECFSQKQLMQYKKYCKVYEDSCPHNGGWWSNQSANRQFGLASSPGDFYGNGSSRWKQRAFYDYIKDILTIIGGKPLIRISVYDTCTSFGRDRKVGRLLESDDYMNYTQEILTMIAERPELKLISKS